MCMVKWWANARQITICIFSETVEEERAKLNSWVGQGSIPVRHPMDNFAQLITQNINKILR